MGTNLLTNVQAEFDLSHIYPMRGSNPHQTDNQMIKHGNEKYAAAQI